jgi:protease-4
MSKGRALFLGVGCMFLILGTLIVVLAAIGMRSPSLGNRLVLSLRLDRPIAEVVAKDPILEMTGEQPIGLRQLRSALLRAADDDRVVGVRVRIDRFGGGLATAQEFRGLLDEVRAAGKWTVAYLDTAGEFAPGNIDYLAAATCDEISLHPMGDVNLIGLSIRFPFMRGMLDKLGVRPEYPEHGEYKDAGFQYTRREFTEEQREMYSWLGESLLDQMVEGVADRRGLEQDRVRWVIDNGPFLGVEAMEVGLVDYLEDWDEFKRRVSERADRAQIVGMKTYLDRSRRAASGPKIAVVTGVGTILRGESGKSVSPMLSGNIMGAETMVRAFRNARRQPGVKAVVFRVDSPGGTPLASEIIRREMARTAARIPVVVSMSSVGASGGYWIACGAQRIVANRAAQVGSIGVIAGHLNLGGFWSDKIGVDFGRLDFGANANMYGMLEDWTDPQREVVERVLDRTYDHFVNLVAEARNMPPEQVHALGEGRVFTGEQALANGLIDEVGGFEEALATARELAGIQPDAPVRLVEFPKARPWWQQMIGRRGADETAVQEFVDVIEEVWRTGTLRVPGIVWMPSIHIE